MLEPGRLCRDAPLFAGLTNPAPGTRSAQLHQTTLFAALARPKLPPAFATAAAPWGRHCACIGAALSHRRFCTRLGDKSPWDGLEPAVQKAGTREGSAVPLLQGEIGEGGRVVASELQTIQLRPIFVTLALPQEIGRFNLPIVTLMPATVCLIHGPRGLCPPKCFLTSTSNSHSISLPNNVATAHLCRPACPETSGPFDTCSLHAASAHGRFGIPLKSRLLDSWRPHRGPQRYHVGTRAEPRCAKQPPPEATSPQVRIAASFASR